MFVAPNGTSSISSIGALTSPLSGGIGECGGTPTFWQSLVVPRLRLRALAMILTAGGAVAEKGVRAGTTPPLNPRGT